MGTAYTDTGTELAKNPVFDQFLTVGFTRTSNGQDAGLAVYLDDEG